MRGKEQCRASIKLSIFLIHHQSKRIGGGFLFSGEMKAQA
jgi:hypothetical protein